MSDTSYLHRCPPSLFKRFTNTCTTEHKDCRFEDYFFDRSSSTSLRRCATLVSAYCLTVYTEHVHVNFILKYALMPVCCPTALPT